MKGHRVNECPKLTHTQRKQFWDYHNNACREASKDGTSHPDAAKNVKPAEDDTARVKYERYQHLMSAM